MDIFVLWLVAAIVGSVGIYFAITEQKYLRPTAFVAFSLFAITPSFYLGPLPFPLLTGYGIPGFDTMPVRVTIGIILILLLSAIVSWFLAILTNRLACRCDRATGGAIRWLIPFTFYGGLFLVFHLIFPFILTLMTLLGLYDYELGQGIG